MTCKLFIFDIHDQGCYNSATDVLIRITSIHPVEISTDYVDRYEYRTDMILSLSTCLTIVVGG
jgi:hypothetical protein